MDSAELSWITEFWPPDTELMLLLERTTGSLRTAGELLGETKDTSSSSEPMDKELDSAELPCLLPTPLPLKSSELFFRFYAF